MLTPLNSISVIMLLFMCVCVKRGSDAEPATCPAPISVPVTVGESLDPDRDSATSADEQQQLINR